MDTIALLHVKIMQANYSSSLLLLVFDTLPRILLSIIMLSLVVQYNGQMSWLAFSDTAQKHKATALSTAISPIVYAQYC